MVDVPDEPIAEETTLCTNVCAAAKTEVAAEVNEVNPVPPYAAAIVVPFQVPEVIVPTVLKEDKVVAEDVNSVPEVGRVTLVAPVVVNVKLFAPEVTKFPARVMV